MDEAQNRPDSGDGFSAGGPNSLPGTVPPGGNVLDHDIRPNYHDRLLEPTVLPGKFPNLLINGGIGIAVGMATSLPPHNPLEVFDSIIRTLDNPQITLGELMSDVTSETGTIIRQGIKG